jgi:NAD(P)-dependent dehydrogenase (short-subunit alcohol dehydrogenase family)
MGRVEGKVAIVTGGTAGIGRAAARALAAEGARVVITGRDKSRGEAAARALAEAGATVRFLVQDVTDATSWRNVFSAALDGFGGLDILVNNAGSAAKGEVDTVAPETLRAQMRLHVEPAFLSTRLAIEAMGAKGSGGSIVNMSSTGAQRAVAGYGAYCAAKAALTAMSRALAVEAARMTRRIRVNAVHPGYVLSDALERAMPVPKAELDATFAPAIPLERVGTVEDVAAAVLFLASDEADYITGADLNVDGGLFAMV